MRRLSKNPTGNYQTAATPPHAPSSGVLAAASTNPVFFSDYEGLPLPPLQVESRISKGNTPWSTGLCGCFDDVRNCFLTCLCPCITFGRIAEIVDRGSTSCGTAGVLYMLVLCTTGCPCLYSCFYRNKMRYQHGVAGDGCSDCVIHCFCESCALCQEYRELKNRDYDLTHGWQGNMEKKANTMTFPPPAGAGGMTR